MSQATVQQTAADNVPTKWPASFTGMMRLKNRDIGPPGFFTFVHSETAHTSKGTNWFAWQEAIMAHRKANELPIPGNMMEIAEDQLCKTIPPGWCERSEQDGNPVITRFGFQDVVNGMIAFGKLMLGGFHFVDQAEADRRAKICSGCYLNVNAEGCGTCRKIAEMVTGDVAKKRTQWDSLLKVCGVCRCVNAVKVWFPLDTIPATDEQQAMFPDFCWQKLGGENYVHGF